MSNIRRVYVEKRPGFDREAKRLCEDIRLYLNLSALTDVRVLNRYDVEGMQDASFERACATIFAEPNLDFLTHDTFPMEPGWTAFAVEYLPGQFDMRADSAVQCAQMLGDAPLIRTARIIVLKGNLSDTQISTIKIYCINPVESREASMDMPESLALDAPPPCDIPRIKGFCAMDTAALVALHRDMGLAMSVEGFGVYAIVFSRRGTPRPKRNRDPGA